jgi:hypothetical protein
VYSRWKSGADWLVILVFDTEDWGNTFTRNFREFSPYSTASWTGDGIRHSPCCEISNSMKNFLPPHRKLNVVLPISIWSQDSSIGIATGYRLDDWGFGVRVPVESRIFSSSHRPDRLWGPSNFLSKRVPGSLSPGVKLLRREADHSPPPSAEVKKVLIYTSTALYTFMA